MSGSISLSVLVSGHIFNLVLQGGTRLGLKCQTSAFPLTIPKILGLVLST